MHSWDRSFGGVVHFPIPTNLGTPGKTNSAAISSPAPTVSELIHSPAVPSSSEPVRVIARVHSVLPLTSVVVRHRLDNASGGNAWQSTAMHDDGSNGDEVAGDNLYTATLTQYQNNNAVVQFYVQAGSTGRPIWSLHGLQAECYGWCRRIQHL